MFGWCAKSNMPEVILPFHPVQIPIHSFPYSRVTPFFQTVIPRHDFDFHYRHGFLTVHLVDCLFYFWCILLAIFSVI